MTVESLVQEGQAVRNPLFLEKCVQDIISQFCFDVFSNPCNISNEFENNFNTDDFIAFLNYEESTDPIINKVQLVLMESQVSYLPLAFKNIQPYIELCASKCLKYNDYLLLGHELINEASKKRELLLQEANFVEFSPKAVFAFISELPEAAKEGDFWLNFVFQPPAEIEETAKDKKQVAKKQEVLDRSCDKLAAAIRFIENRAVNEEGKIDDNISDCYQSILKDYEEYLLAYSKYKEQLSSPSEESINQKDKTKAKEQNDTPPECVVYECFLICCLCYLEFIGRSKNIVTCFFNESPQFLYLLEDISRFNLDGYVENECSNSDFLLLLDPKKAEENTTKGELSLEQYIIEESPPSKEWVGKTSIYHLGFADFRIVEDIVMNPIVDEILKNKDTLLRQRECYNVYSIFADYFKSTDYIKFNISYIKDKNCLFSLEPSYFDRSYQRLPNIIDVSSLSISGEQLLLAYKIHYSATNIFRENNNESSLSNKNQTSKDKEILTPIEEEKKYIFDRCSSTYNNLSDRDIVRYLKDNHVCMKLVLDEEYETEFLDISQIKNLIGLKAFCEHLSLPFKQNSIESSAEIQLVHSIISPRVIVDRSDSALNKKKDDKKDDKKQLQKDKSKEEVVVVVEEKQVVEEVVLEEEVTIASLIRKKVDEVACEETSRENEFSVINDSLNKFSEICVVELLNTVQDREKVKLLKEQKHREKYVQEFLSSNEVNSVNSLSASRNNSFENQQEEENPEENDVENEPIILTPLEDAFTYFKEHNLHVILSRALSDLMIATEAGMVDDAVEFLGDTLIHSKGLIDEDVERTELLDGSQLGNTAEIIEGIEGVPNETDDAV